MWALTFVLGALYAAMTYGFGMFNFVDDTASVGRVLDLAGPVLALVIPRCAFIAPCVSLAASSFVNVRTSGIFPGPVLQDRYARRVYLVPVASLFPPGDHDRWMAAGARPLPIR